MGKEHEHKTIEVRSYCAECGQEFDKKRFNRGDIVTLENEQATALPGREAMSLINANIAAPINAALALNVLSDGSIAYASATQTAPITQTT